MGSPGLSSAPSSTLLTRDRSVGVGPDFDDQPRQRRRQSVAVLMSELLLSPPLLVLTRGVQLLAQIPGPFPGQDEFRIERIVEFPGQHLVLFTAHSASLVDKSHP